MPQCSGDSQAYALLGVSLDEQGRYAEAHRALLHAISLNPGWVPFHNNLAVSYLHSGDKAAAMAEFQRALRLEPNNQAALLNLAAYYVEQKDFHRALKYLSDAGAEGSEDPDTLMLLTRAYFGVGSTTQAFATAQQLSRVAGDDPKLHFSLGLLFAEHDKPAEAIQQFLLIPTTDRDYETYQNLGLAYVKVGNPDEARAAFEAATRLEPQKPEAYIELSRIYVASHQPDQAVYLLSQANQRAPERTEVTFALAELLTQIKRFDQAENLLTDAIKKHAANAMLWQARGDLFKNQQQDEPAIAAYRKSLQIDPKEIGPRVGLAQIYQRTGKPEQAKTEYQTVLRAAPHSVEANTGMGEIAYQAGLTEEAITYLNRALDQAPDNSEAGELLATIRVRDGKYEEADQILRRLMGSDPDNPRIHYLEGRVLAKLGKSDDSQVEFEKARQLTAANPAAERQ
jgi:Flp pilus assembly protein TadD